MTATADDLSENSNKVFRATISCLLQLADARTLLYFRRKAMKMAPTKETKELDTEVFTRAAIILSVTAWETFVEDVLLAMFEERLNKAQEPTDVKSTFLQASEAWLKSKPKPSELLRACFKSHGLGICQTFGHQMDHGNQD